MAPPSQCSREQVIWIVEQHAKLSSPEHSDDSGVLKSDKGVLRNAQSAQECSAWHSAPLSRSLVPRRIEMVTKINSEKIDYISYSSHQAGQLKTFYQISQNKP